VVRVREGEREGAIRKEEKESEGDWASDCGRREEPDGRRLGGGGGGGGWETSAGTRMQRGKGRE
jgi:hypothetical protein